MTRRLVIYLLLAGCLAFGAIVVLELKSTATNETTANDLPRRPNGPPAVRRQQNTQLEESLATILGRPLFNSSRRPPQTVVDDGRGSSDLGDTRLTGIVTEPGHNIAIFAVNGAKP